MKGVWAFCCFAGLAATLPATPLLAQSGVISGPPQVERGQGGLAQDPQSNTWIAVVGGFGGNGKKVSVGYSGVKGTRSDAEAAAVRACTRGEPSVACSSPFAVSAGCLYIVPGTRAGGGVTWGRGGTPTAAFDECRRGGYTCLDNKLVGGCLPGNN
jgi:hypothetical protein